MIKLTRFLIKNGCVVTKPYDKESESLTFSYKGVKYTIEPEYNGSYTKVVAWAVINENDKYLDFGYTQKELIKIIENNILNPIEEVEEITEIKEKETLMPAQDNNIIDLNKLNLKVGAKYTILKPNSALPELYKFTLVNYYISNFAQYKNSLYLVVKLKGKRNLVKLVINKNETAFLFNNWNFDQIFKKEKISNIESSLHRFKLEDVKNDKDFITALNDTSFKINNDYESFIDYSFDYMMDNSTNIEKAYKDENYLNYIKFLIQNKRYNLDALQEYCNKESFDKLGDILSNLYIKYGLLYSV